MNKFLRIYSAVLMASVLTACSALGEYTGGKEVPHEWPEKSPGDIHWSSDETGLPQNTEPGPDTSDSNQAQSTNRSSPPTSAKSAVDPDIEDFEQFKQFKVWQKSTEGPNAAPLADDFQLWKEWRAYRQTGRLAQ